MTNVNLNGFVYASINVALDRLTPYMQFDAKIAKHGHYDFVTLTFTTPLASDIMLLPTLTRFSYDLSDRLADEGYTMGPIKIISQNDHPAVVFTLEKKTFLTDIPA
jgi:hypothetical protein